MKHLRLFENETAFEAAKPTLELPWVTLVNDVHKVYFGESGKPSPTIEFVDLGLPSGKKWMKYNLGATSETEYGDYYMWGSVTPNTDTPCDWAHAPFNNGASEFDEDYFNAHKSEWLDGDVLKPEYDAAYQATNGVAHMPTKADFQELINNTNSGWVEDYEGSGINGRLFVSNTNDNRIFIPASGGRWGSSFDLQGDYGNVWASSLGVISPGLAMGLGFTSGDVGASGSNGRSDGFVVRGIL